MASELVAAAEAISAITAIYVFYSTLKACRASSIPLLLGIPAAFGLLTLAFIANLLEATFGANLARSGLMLSVVYLLLETYGVLFLALTYARRTRLKFVGESFSIELAIPGLVTVAVVLHALVFENVVTSLSVPPTMELSLRIVMALAAAYLVYETSRNWSLTRRGGEGAIIFAYTALFVEQVGFMMSMEWFPDVTTFLGYEGRVIGLLLLLGLCSVSVKKDDFTTIIKRLGLAAQAH
jgi:hypothetical protein